MNPNLYHELIETDVCVVGGGMAGLCAAIAAARNGARTVLVHDRPVLGGNASSEIRMHICGAHGPHNKETGILEEIQLENCHRNPGSNLSLWDSVLYEKAAFQPGLRLLLNCSCNDAVMDGGRIAEIAAWQLTTQTWFRIRAKLFIDCSGDSILAPLTGADCRRGREARAEHNEDIEPSRGDDKTMGNTILIQFREMPEPQPFVAPRWASRFRSPEEFPCRLNGVEAHNFWWLELGGLSDTIRDAEAIRAQLMPVVYGVWDYLKNHAPKRDLAANWALEWIGALPGKRENRRYLGPHILTQNDVRAGGQFSDIVAYGGWSMDDHHPAGLLYPGKPTIFHPAPSPYGIPYRSLYSRNVGNLLFAGRNISVTHAALSSTRVMATCAILGQAAGTAAALCVAKGLLPAGLYPAHVPELQRTLMVDDCWLPGLLRPLDPLTLSASIADTGEGRERLLDGLDRDRDQEAHAWTAVPGTPLELSWAKPVQVGGLRLVLDSDLADGKRLLFKYPLKARTQAVPPTLLHRFRIEARNAAGAWETVCHETENYQRLVMVPLNVRTQALRLVPEATWGAAAVRVFACEALGECVVKQPRPAPGPNMAELRASVAPAHLAPPECDPHDLAKKK